MPSPGPLGDDEFAEVLAAAKSGQSWAIRRMFEDLQPRILRFLAGVEPRGADDIAGDTWLAIAKGIHGFDGDLVQFRAWVFVIVRRRVSDHRRKESKRPQPPSNPEQFASLLEDPDITTGIERLSEREAAELILALLPPAHAEVVLLRIVVGLDVDSVAEVVGRTPNWVRITQHRALRQLEERLAPKRTRRQRINETEPS